MLHLSRALVMIGIFIGVLLPGQAVTAQVGSEPYNPLQSTENQPSITPNAELQAAAWYDGSILYSQITNCVSIIQGAPYSEAGVGVYVGFAADPNLARPAPGQVYYLHVVAYGLGNACSGQRVWVDFSLPPNTSLAVSPANPVYCFAGGMANSYCPQSLQSSPYNPGAISIPSNDSAHAYTWPLPQGGNWEFQIPVISSTTLTASPFQAHVLALDGNSSPWLRPVVGVYVFSGNPVILYPTPSTTITGTITPAYKSNALLYNFSYSGTVTFDLGLTTSYGFTDSGPITTAYPAYEVWTDWAGFAFQPNTTYHWRMRFQTSGGSWTYGADQTFTTPALGKITVGTGTSASCTGAAFDTALATGGVKEIIFNCGSSPVNVTFSGVRTISGPLKIDGGNKVTLSAAPNSRHFDISGTGNLSLSNIALTGGRGSVCGGSIKIASGGWLTGSRLQFTNNQTTGNGGALCVESGGNADLSYALFKNNSAGGSGGAAYNQGILGLMWSDVSNNTAQINGGGLWNSYILDVFLSLIADNGVPTGAVARGTHEGGGIYNISDASVRVSTVTGNTAYYAAGIYSNNATAWLIGATLAGNSAAGGIGGLESKGSGGSQIRNSIIANNLPDNCGTGYTKTISSNGNNLESSNQCNLGAAGDKVNTNPRLLALKWNGGFSRTMALQSGSPAIDAADNVYCGYYDQRGFSGPPSSEIVSRNVDGDANGSIICDMGAFEFHPEIDNQTQIFLPLIKR